MRDVSKGRFERMQCVKCGAHAMVPVPTTAAVACEVCGGRNLTPIDDKRARPKLAPEMRRSA